MFIGLAIVCDDYFVPALDRIAEGKGFDLNSCLTPMSSILGSIPLPNMKDFSSKLYGDS